MELKYYLKKYESKKDFSEYWKIVTNEEVMKMNFGRIFTKEEASGLFDYMVKANETSGDFGYFRVYNSDNDEYIGDAAIGKSDSDDQVEIEYMLMPEYWGKGLGKSIVDTLLGIIKTHKDIKKVIGIISPDNIRSRKILEGKGFTSVKVFTIDDGSEAEILEKNI